MSDSRKEKVSSDTMEILSMWKEYMPHLVWTFSDALSWGFQVRVYLNQISLEELVLIALNQERIGMFGYLEVSVSEFYVLSALLIFMYIYLYL